MICGYAELIWPLSRAGAVTVIVVPRPLTAAVNRCANWEVFYYVRARANPKPMLILAAKSRVGFTPGGRETFWPQLPDLIPGRDTARHY